MFYSGMDAAPSPSTHASENQVAKSDEMLLQENDDIF
jgi:hypothetical protein